MELSALSTRHRFYKMLVLTASIRHALIVTTTAILSVNVAVADIVIDDDASEGPATTITAPNNHTQAVNFTDNSGAAIRINDTNGATVH